MTVAWQVRAASVQARKTQQAELLADAFFDMFHAFSENRRAQIEPVDDALLRTSSDAFYSAALRITTLADGETLRSLHRFMMEGFKRPDATGSPVTALWDLHDQIVRALGYRSPIPATYS